MPCRSGPHVPGRDDQALRVRLPAASSLDSLPSATSRADQPPDPGREGEGADQPNATGQLAELRREHANLRAGEERVTAVGRRLVAEINAFRAGKEATKAAYAAAEDAAKTVSHR